jgi:hypothetical protein
VWKVLAMACFCRNLVMRSRLALRCGFLLSIVIVGICAVNFGCKRRCHLVEPELPQVITNRMHDAAYVRSLQENSTRQMAAAHKRESVSARQKACVERVKATLAEGAGEEELKAALQKDAEWVELEAEASKAADALQKAQEDAKNLIRARMEAEAQAIKDVQGGKARAVEMTGAAGDLKKGIDK